LLRDSARALTENYGMRASGHGSNIVQQALGQAMQLPGFSSCHMVIADTPMQYTRFWQRLNFEQTNDLGGGLGRFIRRLAT